MHKNIEQLESILRIKERELYSIQKIGQALSSTLNLDQLLLLIMKEITDLMNADRSTLYLVDPSKKEIWSKIALKAEIKEIRQKFGIGISGYVAATGEIVNIPDAYRDVRFDPSTDARTGYTTKSILCMPVWEPDIPKGKRQLIGVIQVLNKKSGPFTEEDQGILQAISSQVAISLSNAKLYQQLEIKYRQIDLLHDFEEKLSSEFDIQVVLKNMLKSTVQRLNAQQVGIIFPLNGKIFVLGLNHLGHYLDRQYSSIEETLGETLNQPSLLQNLEFETKIKTYFNLSAESNTPEVNFISCGSKERSDINIILLFQPMPNSMITYQTPDIQVLEIVAQKIIRALEIHKIREELLQKERLSAIGQMMSKIVHDLRSPITSIYGFTELLVAEGTTTEEIKEYADIILLEIQTLSNMIKEILDYAKGKTSILPRKCVAEDILKRFKPQADQLFRNTRIKFEVWNNSKKLIYADIEKMTRLLYNIAKNAKEAMNDEGNFNCKAFDRDNQVIFELVDNGPGIPDEIRDRLFENFVSSGKEKGTGLGLAIVKKIAEDHHGRIEIKSEKGKGTSFFVKLPEVEVESEH
jgi:signal transduction histidine kinase/putative methionine-R-sulfoxide reductase with GAF domain